MKRFLPVSSFFLLSAILSAQGGLDPSDILKPLGDQWPIFAGDYTGKRYSSLKLIDQSTVKHLSLAWVTRFTAGSGPNGGGGGGRAGGGSSAPIIVGGLGQGDLNSGGPARLGGGILMVDGILYMSVPDNAWAVDARDGTILWHYYWKTRGGTHTGNRGMGMWHNNLYLEVHDDYLICLDAKTGHEKWKKENIELRSAVLFIRCPHRNRQSHPGGHRQRYGCAWFSAIVRPGNGRAAVDLLHRADERGRSRVRNLGEP